MVGGYFLLVNFLTNSITAMISIRSAMTSNNVMQLPPVWRNNLVADCL